MHWRLSVKLCVSWPILSVHFVKKHLFMPSVTKKLPSSTRNALRPNSNVFQCIRKLDLDFICDWGEKMDYSALWNSNFTADLRSQTCQVSNVAWSSLLSSTIRLETDICQASDLFQVGQQFLLPLKKRYWCKISKIWWNGKLHLGCPVEKLNMWLARWMNKHWLWKNEANQVQLVRSI